jgi:CRP-like cAMP-binding protein
MSNHKLGSTDVFKGLDPDELNIVEARAQEMIYGANSIVFREGEPGDRMFLIVDGVIEIWKSDGKELKGSRLARLKENEIFGEMAIFDKEPRSASAYAVINNQTRILVWSEKDLNDLIREHPEMGLKILTNMLQKMSNRLRVANEAIHTLLRANRYIGL